MFAPIVAGWARGGPAAPAVVAGVSGIDLALTSALDAKLIQDNRKVWAREAMAFSPTAEASAEYWAGGALAYYQWACGRSFRSIQALVPIVQIAVMYSPYHEMDISGFCAAMDRLCAEAYPQTNLQERRVLAGLSQSQLASATGVPVRTIQQYEQRQKSIIKAQVQYLVALACGLHCEAGGVAGAHRRASD